MIKYTCIIFLIIIFISIIVILNNKEEFQTIGLDSSNNNKMIKLILLNFIRYLHNYLINMNDIYNNYNKIFKYFEKNYYFKLLNENSNELITDISNNYTLYDNITKISYNELDSSKYNDLLVQFDKIKDIIGDNFILHKDLYNSNSKNKITECDSKININSKNVKLFLGNIKNKYEVINTNNKFSSELIIENITTINTNLNNYDLKNDFKEELITFFNQCINTLNYVYNNNIDFNIFKIITDIINNCDQKKIIKELDQIKFKEYLTSSKSKIDDLNNSCKRLINIIERSKNILTDIDGKNFFAVTNKNQEIESKFCEKLRKLDKPNKNNLVFKRFSQDIINKKKKYISKLENKINEIQNNMTNKEIYNYNIDRLSSHEKSSKHYNAIIKGINNIKNQNKIKINLT